MLLESNHQLRPKSKLNLYLKGTKLEIVDEFLQLDVLLNSGLKLNAHVEHILRIVGV